MKKSYLAFIVSALVLFTCVLWFFSSGTGIGFAEMVQFLVILLLIGFGLFAGIRRIKSERRKEPADDEMSKRIVRKASSIAFFISIYIWLILMYIADKKIYETDIIFGAGILGMGLIFAISWIVISIIGLKNE